MFLLFEHLIHDYISYPVNLSISSYIVWCSNLTFMRIFVVK